MEDDEGNGTRTPVETRMELNELRIELEWPQSWTGSRNMLPARIRG